MKWKDYIASNVHSFLLERSVCITVGEGPFILTGGDVDTGEGPFDSYRE